MEKGQQITGHELCTTKGQYSVPTPVLVGKVVSNITSAGFTPYPPCHLAEKVEMSKWVWKKKLSMFSLLPAPLLLESVPLVWFYHAKDTCLSLRCLPYLSDGQFLKHPLPLQGSPIVSQTPFHMQHPLDSLKGPEVLLFFSKNFGGSRMSIFRVNVPCFSTCSPHTWIFSPFPSS